jgi:hypothetical protein
MSLYDLVRPLPRRVFPWFDDAKKATLARLLKPYLRTDGARPTVIEIGSWFGD